MKEGAFLLPQLFYKMNAGFTLFLQNSDGTFSRIDPIIEKPLFNEYVNSILNEKENVKKVLQIIVEWDLSLKEEFEIKSMKEQIIENYSLLNYFKNESDSVKLRDMILDDFSEFEYIQQSWECPKCSKTSRSIQIGLHKEPDILVFYINRFEKSEKGAKKNVKNVAIPLELTELLWFFDDVDELLWYKKYKKYYKYNLSCVIFHHGNKSSSGHYTAATRNFIDGEWRLFDDTEVKVLDQESQRKEIFESSNSFMLFYQRERSKDEYLRRAWFPRDVPYEIVRKYNIEEIFKNDKE